MTGSSRNYLTVTAMAAVCFGLAAAPAGASIILHDGNSFAQFDLSSAAGLHSWTVDGREYMYKQWFWYRVGPNGKEESLDSLTLDAWVLSDLNGDDDKDTLYARYLRADFKIDLWFILAGGTVGSGASDLGEIIRITNTSGQNLDFHFFQYADFNLSDQNDTVEITGGTETMAGNTAHQTAPPVQVAETVVTPRPSHDQVGVDGDILASLTDAGPTTLNDASGPVTGDVAWAFEWDQVIAPGRTLLISKDKNIVPEPATLALMGSGVAMVLFVRRKRK